MLFRELNGASAVDGVLPSDGWSWSFGVVFGRQYMIKQYTIQSGIRQALSSKGFLAGIVGLVAVVLLASVENLVSLLQQASLLPYGFHVQFLLHALESDTFTLALPILCALPFTTAFVDDMKNGFIKQYLSRTSRKEYIQGKLVACGLSGGLVLCLGMLICFFLSFLVFTPMELAPVAGEETQPYWMQLFRKICVLTVSGVLWSLVGLAFSTLTMNRYMAYAAPFIFYYVLLILYERYFDWIYVLYPKEWLFPVQEWVWGDIGILALLIEFIIVMGLWISLLTEKRLENV